MRLRSLIKSPLTWLLLLSLGLAACSSPGAGGQSSPPPGTVWYIDGQPVNGEPLISPNGATGPFLGKYLKAAPAPRLTPVDADAITDPTLRDRPVDERAILHVRQRADSRQPLELIPSILNSVPATLLTGQQDGTYRDEEVPLDRWQPSFPYFEQDSGSTTVTLVSVTPINATFREMLREEARDQHQGVHQKDAFFSHEGYTAQVVDHPTDWQSEKSAAFLWLARTFPAYCAPDEVTRGGDCLYERPRQDAYTFQGHNLVVLQGHLRTVTSDGPGRQGQPRERTVQHGFELGGVTYGTPALLDLGDYKPNYHGMYYDADPVSAELRSIQARGDNTAALGALDLLEAPVFAVAS